MRAEGRHCPCILIPEALFTITKLQQSRAGKTCKMNSPKILIFKVKMLRLVKVSPTHKASWPSEISATPQGHVSRCPISGKRKQEHTTSLWSLRIPQCISMRYYFRRSFTRWRCHDPGFSVSQESQVQVCKITCSGNDELHVRLLSQGSPCTEFLQREQKTSAVSRTHPTRHPTTASQQGNSARFLGLKKKSETFLGLGGTDLKGIKAPRRC